LTDKPNAEGSKLFFGAPRPEYFTGDLHWHKLTKDDYWRLNVTSISKNGQNQKQEGDQMSAIMDSGTSLLVVSNEIMDFWGLGY